jgi:hypothetical protein
MRSLVPAANTRAFVTFPATAGKAWVIHSIEASMLASGGITVATNGMVEVTDGAAILWAIYLALPPIVATGQAIDKVFESGLGIVGAVGDALVVGFLAAGGANTYESISAGAYLI